jgi:hypothetical protein
MLKSAVESAIIEEEHSAILNKTFNLSLCQR